MSWVALRACTIPDAGTPNKSENAARKSCTVDSALRLERTLDPRLLVGAVVARAIASATTAGVCVPPGPSKCAMPDESEGNSARKAKRSRGM